MRLTIASLLLAVSSLPVDAAAVPAVETTLIEGKKAPHHFAAMDITDGIPQGPPLDATAALQPRRKMDYCVRDPARSGVCVAVAAVLGSVGSTIASSIKGSSNNHDCTLHTGSIDNVTWQAYATGENCDTKASVGTIAGAIDEYLRDQNGAVCGVHCLKLSLGGKWTGYVTLAANGEALNTYYCGSSGSFGQCGSGGEADAHN